MKEQIMQRLMVTIGTLNTVEVKGEQNLAGLVGSIQVLRETVGILEQVEIQTPDKKEGDANGVMLQ